MPNPIALSPEDAADDKAVRTALIATWTARAEGQHLTRGSAKYAKAQLEFFIGAHALCAVLGRPHVLPEMMLVMLSVGHDAADFAKP